MICSDLFYADNTEKFMNWKQYKRKGLSEMRAYEIGEDVSHVSISDEDRKNGSPKVGDMIARNPKNQADQWLVARKYFEDNLEPAQNVEVDDEERRNEFDRTDWPTGHAPTDRLGNELHAGDSITVYQKEETTKAKVLEASKDRPTINEKGWWIEIDRGDGPEGMMSYILEIASPNDLGQPPATGGEASTHHQPLK